jgi:tetratricopeptide (TPR) repeat protein
LRRRWHRVLGAGALWLALGAGALAKEPAAVRFWRSQARAAAQAGDFDKAIRLLRKAVDASPTAPVVKDLAGILSWSGRAAESIPWYRKYLDLRPDDDEVRLTLANVLSWQKDRALLAESLKLFDAYLGRQPEDWKARLQRGRVRSWVGRIADAQADFEAYLRKHPSDEKILLELGQVLSLSKDRAFLLRAAGVYSEYLKRHPGDAEVILRRARVRSWADRIDEAAQDYRAYLEKRPGDDAVRLELATAFSWSKDEKLRGESLVHLDVYLKARPDDLKARLLRARVRVGAKRGREAVEDFTAYLEKNVDDDKVLLEAATTLQSLKDTPSMLAALGLYDRYLRKHPGAAQVLLQRARVRSWAGRLQESASDYGAYLKKNPSDEAMALELAQVLQSAKDPQSLERALAIYDAHLAKRPEDDKVLLQRARVRSWVGKTRESVADYEAYLGKHPQEQPVRLEIAAVLSTAKDPRSLKRVLAIYNEHLKASPDDEKVLLQRARVKGWAGQTEEALNDFEAYLRRHPRDDKVRVEVAAVLSYSKDKALVARSLPLYDVHLNRSPDDLEARLQRARARSWLAMTKEAEEDFRSYLQKRPGDDKVKLELAMVLSWSKDKREQARALSIFDEYLRDHPEDDQALLQRARIKSWLGKHKEAVVDYRAYLSRNADASARAALADALAEAGRYKEAMKEYQLIETMGGDAGAVALARARMHLRQGKHELAERGLKQLLDAETERSLRDQVEVELARLYSQTRRGLQAIDVLEGVLSRNPSDRDAQVEKDRLEAQYRPAAGPRMHTYVDNQGLWALGTSLDAKVYADRRVNAFVDAGSWRLKDSREVLWVHRLDFGVRVRPWEFVEFEAALGPRIYQLFSTKAGGHLTVRTNPSDKVKLELRYDYDDIYMDLYQAASVAEQVRGSSIYLQGELHLPYGIAVHGRLQGRFLEPENSMFGVNGQIMFPLSRIFRLGYFGQWLGWKIYDLAYWSPQAYNAHLLVVRASQKFAGMGLEYEIQAGVGTAGERVMGIPESGYGIAFSGVAALSWAPYPWLSVRVSAQYGQTVRELVKEELACGDRCPPNQQRIRITESNSYLWLMCDASVAVSF